MPQSFLEMHKNLGDRLLKAGVAPRHVRRYLRELADHLADLRAEEERAGRNPAEAESAALLRLGGIDDLFKAMAEQRQLQSWSARAPWAMFGLAPVVFLASAYFVALFILWSGWRMFLPWSETPFIKSYGVSVLYFAVGRWLYFTAPVLVGWGIGLVAARQRLKLGWPAMGVALVALLGAAARVHASRPVGGSEQVNMHFALGSSVPIRALVILSVAAMPYLLWRVRQRYFLAE
jgi:hypothetical protein